MSFLFWIVDRRAGVPSPLRQKICVKCNTEFQGQAATKYCPACKAKPVRRAKKATPVKKGGWHEITCAACSKKELRKGPAKFCIDCKNKKDRDAAKAAYKLAHLYIPIAPKKAKQPKQKATRTTFFCVKCNSDKPLSSLARKFGPNGHCIACEKRVERSIKARKAQPKKKRAPISENTLNQICRWVNNHGG